MNSNPPNKRRGNWTQEALDKAIEAVSNKTMSDYKASRLFGIPRRTLRRYIQSNTTGKAKLGRKSALSSEQNSDLCSMIVRLAKIGYPITTKVLRLCIYKYCMKNNINHQFSYIKQIASHKWARRFLKANPTIAHWKSRNLKRTQELNKFNIEKHFKSLQDILEKNNLFENPERIFSMDEKILNLHNKSTVLAQKEIKEIHTDNEHNESVTVILCVNAMGLKIPPMILFKNNWMKPEFANGLPPGSVCYMTERNSMTSKIFVSWICHFVKYKPVDPCLLMLNGTKSHLDFDIVEVAEQNNILLYCLPSITSHELQPLDQGWSFEYHWDEELQLQLSKGEKTLTKQHFAKIFSKVWNKCLTSSYIKSSFKTCGIVPFDPSIIPETAPVPNTVNEISALENITSTAVSPHIRATVIKKHSSSKPGPSDNNIDIIHPEIHFWFDDEEDLIETAIFNETCLTEDDMSDTEHVTSFRKVIPKKVTSKKKSKSTNRKPTTRSSVKKKYSFRKKCKKRQAPKISSKTAKKTI